jgi:hypothetical protein
MASSKSENNIKYRQREKTAAGLLLLKIKKRFIRFSFVLDFDLFVLE